MAYNAATRTQRRLPKSTNKLHTTRDDGRGLVYEMLVHVAVKRWMDVDCLIEDYQAALERDATELGSSVNVAILARSIDKARSVNANI